MPQTSALRGTPQTRFQKTPLVPPQIPAQDTSRAQEFYKGIFGWQFQAMEGPFEYHMAQVAEDAGSAVFPGDTGAIRVYFDVDDINAGASRLQELGGKADDSQAIPGIGYFAACTDPEGNPFSLYKDDPSAKMEQAEQEARA